MLAVALAAPSSLCLTSGELGNAEGGVEAGDGGDGGNNDDGRHTQLLLLVGAMHTPLRVEEPPSFERNQAPSSGTSRSFFTALPSSCAIPCGSNGF